MTELAPDGAPVHHVSLARHFGCTLRGPRRLWFGVGCILRRVLRVVDAPLPYSSMKLAAMI